jgi:alkanesulfonate monooxygenase SsuD/methylene tetrahydromethanopterin reductase-like flavin-dependent oxidoreductase (luciferase family)
MKRLWTEDNVTHKGKFYNVENLSVGPKPVQKPHPPIWTGGSAETALKRAGTWANGFISGSSAIADFHVTWDKIASYAVAAGRNPNEITKASLAFMAINDDKAKAVKCVEEYTMRYYGRIRNPVENVSIVGSANQCVERIEYFLSKGLDALIIGVSDPDPRQLDLFGEKVLPQLK